MHFPVVYTNSRRAKAKAAKYAEMVKDDVYVKRHAGGREYRLWTRKEMIEFQSENIVGYIKYSPHEKIHNLVNLLFQTKNITPAKITLTKGTIRVLDKRGTTYILSIRESEPTEKEYKELEQ